MIHRTSVSCLPVTGYQVISHPSATLLQRPELAQYVWDVTETGSTFSSRMSEIF